MTDPTPTSLPVPTEKTFSSFNKEQGANYAKIRPGYHPNLYRTIIDQHTSTGGQLNSILDVGCGPGVAIEALAPHFTHATGIDPSEGMIKNARLLTVTTSTSQPIRFEIGSAESLGTNLSPPVEDASVDLITASTAAHWFDMAKFWPAAARVLKPGGSVAIWTVGDAKMHRDMPNAAAIQAALDEIEERELKPFFAPGNLLTRSLYADLLLPWTASPSIPDFDEVTFFRKEWGPDANDSDEFWLGNAVMYDMNMIEKIMGTTSPVQRWREANKELVGTERDVTRLMRRAIERLLQEAGVEEGKEFVKSSIKGVLLMVKKKL
jgi:SAM-dependent methyltransferase